MTSFSTVRAAPASLLLCAVLAIGLITACQTPVGKAPTQADTVPTPLVLAPGDSLEVTFPGAPNLNTKVRIGPEGTIAMPLVGQVQAAGKTAAELQSELLKKYENQLQEKEVLVTVTESGNLVYVTGAVLRPGQLPMNRPMTALDAIMQAGGFTDTANRKKVTVIRYEGDRNVSYLLNLEPLYSGGPVPPFYLRPRDIVDVPQKVQWF